VEINATTTGAEAAATLINGSALAAPDAPPITLTSDQQAAITAAIKTLLAEAGIADADTVEVHLATSVDGKWAVLRVAHVKEA
jgi:hypothetical protein